VLPGVRPLIVHEVALVVVHDAPPGDAVAEYPFTVPVFVKAGAVHETAAVALPGVAVTFCGASGAT